MIHRMRMMPEASTRSKSAIHGREEYMFAIRNLMPIWSCKQRVQLVYDIKLLKRFKRFKPH